jgi:hypothetical protein
MSVFGIRLQRDEVQQWRKYHNEFHKLHPLTIIVRVLKLRIKYGEFLD